jgi:uncharacterized iron-regulated membrane protein
MANRVYNIMFHTHTVSGISISALLFVIFFAGSISFLRDEISAWERNESVQKDYFETADYDSLLQKMGEDTNLYGRDITFSNRYFERRVTVNMSASKDTTLQEESPSRGRRGNFFYLNVANKTKSDYAENYSLGEFFYRLHFFAQLNFFGRSGYLLAGIVAFFFLFAVITGVIVHWKKIIPSFYVFRPKAKWKAMWTDAHVGLGLIGLPYQFMFAVTGAYLIVGYTIMTPAVQSFLFNDDAAKMQEISSFAGAPDYTFTGKKLSEPPIIAPFIEKTKEKWPDLAINELQLINYGDANMHVKVGGSPQFEDQLLGTGHLTFRVADGSVVETEDPYASIGYTEGARNLMLRLHYGDFGGYGMKLIYFILGLITCFVILSGVLIWLTARDRKATSPAKKTFNSWLVRIYMAACLSMLPVTAFTFIAVKCFADGFSGTRMDFIFHIFFWSWLGLSVLLLFLRSNYLANKICLVLGGILGIAVPVSNGIMTGNWPWETWRLGYFQIFVVDVFWLALSITALLVAFKLKPRDEAESKDKRFPKSKKQLIEG